MWRSVRSRNLKLLLVPGLAALAAVTVLNPLRLASQGQSVQDDIQKTLDHLDWAADYSIKVKDNLAGLKEFISSGGLQAIDMGDKAELFKGAFRNRSASDPNAPEDFLSQMAGMTQSETSIGWCGDNAVIGFNDSGSFVKTVLTPASSFSFNGYAHSRDGGRTFTDMGALMSGPLPIGVAFRDLYGDPVLGCSRESNFYYASLAQDFRVIPTFSIFNGISVSASGDGGRTFGPARMAAAKSANTHFLDKPWMAVAPSELSASDVIHVTYTDFDSSGTTPPCIGQPRTAIEYVRSLDGGLTWTLPMTMAVQCGGLPAVQGSQIRVGVGSDVYVAWENYPTGIVNQREIRLRKSTNGGATFGPQVVVSSVTPIGTGRLTRGRLRTFIDLQGLAIDTSSGKDAGNVYITWHDGRNLKRPDAFASQGPFLGCENMPRYCFGDILFSSSTNGGANWSPPTRINKDAINSPVDQFFPFITVDKKGDLYVVYYDRSKDPRNLLTDVFLGISENRGATWSNVRVTQNSFASITGWQDSVVNDEYMGDYIAAAADATGKRNGVILSWGDNSLGDANVLFTKKVGDEDDQEHND